MFTISSIHLYILHHVFPLRKGRSQKGSISVHSVLQILNVGSEIHSPQYMFEKYLHPPHPPIVAVIASIITVALIASTKACHSTSRSFLPLMPGENYEHGSNDNKLPQEQVGDLIIRLGLPGLLLLHQTHARAHRCHRGLFRLKSVKDHICEFSSPGPLLCALCSLKSRSASLSSQQPLQWVSQR